MKLNITFTYHYILFLGVAILLAPTTFIHPCVKAKEIKMEKNKTLTVANAKTSEISPADMVFRY